LHHVEAVDLGGVELGEVAGEEIGLFLVVAFDAYAVAAAQDGLQQLAGIFLGHEWAFGQRCGGGESGAVAVAEVIKF
jgi:hypothetical protein